MRNRYLLLIILSILAICGSFAQAWSQPQNDEPDVSAQDLLKPDMFPKAQYGMAVKSVSDGTIAKVITTGGEFLINKAKDSIECRQRISKQRSLATIQFAKGTLSNLKLTNKDTGMAIFSSSRAVVRVNGDSLLMVQPRMSGDIEATLAFTPDYHLEFHGNYNFFDPEGAICFFEHGRCPDSRMEALEDPVTVTWPWKGGDVFWAGVSPPKPYDWDYPLRNKMFRHGSSNDATMYPPDETIKDWYNKGNGNILFLHNETMWKHWNLDLTPRDPESLRRVVNTCHKLGMKLMPYCSPHYFTKNTPAEARANPDPHFGPGWDSGSNELLYLEQASKLVKEYGIDGLYFDAMYLNRRALATDYHLARASRKLVGEKGILEFHATTDLLGDGHYGAYCPTIHAYFDMLLKGEGEDYYNDPGYIRYVASTYNISNVMAVSCYFDNPPSPAMMDLLVNANVHFHKVRDEDFDIYKTNYWPRLTPALKDEILPKLMKPTGEFERFRKSLSTK